MALQITRPTIAWAVEVLTAHNKWRRGCDMPQPFTAKEVGKAMDILCEVGQYQLTVGDLP